MVQKTASLRADAQRNYDLLLHTAEKIFLKNGPAVALESIARQAGVGIGTLYRHFPNRESLIEAVYAPKVLAVITKASSLFNTSPDKALLEWLRMVVRFSEQYNGFGILVRQASMDAHSQLAQAGSQLLENAQSAQLVRSDIMITDLLRLVNALTSDMTKEEVARVDTLIEVILSGLRSSGTA
ncbi:MAG TPA: helix-turn-helix domain-containing protein [Candidatus Saccharimonadia bacterium]|nr:helix-turn-helix domain-containing protein [Candidatus Saccharimonadia bacterium]